MPSYVLSRLAQAVPLVFGILVINFLIVRLAPGDPVLALIGDFPAPPEYVRQLRADMGLDRPLATQLVLYLGKVVQGDLGYSFAQQRPVLTVIAERMGATLLLAATAWILAGVVGIAIGVGAAVRQRSWLDHAAMTTALIGFAMPVFWLGQLLMLLFAIVLGWLPAQGMRATRADYSGVRYVADVAAHMVLPVLALSTRFLAANARLMRASMLEVLGREFVTTARAKGAAETSIVLRHGLRNALRPVVTVMGLNLGLLLTGSALVETVFAWPGVGRLLFDSISTRDFPVIQGIFLIVSATVVLANLLTDMLYAWLDPRIRF